MRYCTLKPMLCLMLSLMLVTTSITGNSAIVEGELADKVSDCSKVEFDVESPLICVETVDANCNLLRYIDEEEFYSHNFAYRIPSEESLNTYVYQDSDGYRTVYVLDDYTKFYDTNGDIIEKDLNLVESENGYTVRKNDIELSMPYVLNDGINIKYSDISMSMFPNFECEDIAVAKAYNETVVYENAFGQNTSLVYTPTFSGIKEDIIISEYNGVSTFSFSLVTSGLCMENKVEEAIPSFNSVGSDVSILLSQIEIYDADGTPCNGNYTILKKDSDNNYTFEIKINEQFLVEASYPIVIDPSITISDNTHGANAIHDASVFSGYPNSNFGGYVYNRVGKPSNDYGVGRTVVRLNKLLDYAFYQNISADRIENITFNVLEGTGTSAQNINLYPLNNTSWTENTVTWNNVGSYSTSVNYSNTLINNQWAAFDITNLVKSWKNGRYDANAGFIMVNTNENLDKCFCSSEHSTASFRPYVVFTYYSAGIGGGENYNTATAMTLNTIENVSIAYPNEKRYFKFTPTSTGFYTFESISDDCDPNAWLYNSDMEDLSFNDDTGSNRNFKLSYHLQSNKTYCLKVGCYSNTIGTYNIKVSRTSSASLIPYTNYTEGTSKYVNLSVPLKIAVYKFTPTNSRNYIFFSSDKTGDPNIWVYNSQLSLIGTNDDSAGNTNYWLDLSLDSGNTYYVVTSHYNNNYGTYKINSIFESNLPSSIFAFKNVSSGYYMDIDNLNSQDLVQQYSNYNSSTLPSREQWLVEKNSDGYYTIRSRYGLNKYLSVSSITTGNDNITLTSTVSNNTKWKIYSDSENRMIICPKTSNCKFLCSPNNTLATNLQLSFSYNHNSLNMWQINSSKLTINTYYDHAFNVRYDNAYNLVNNFSDNVSNVLWKSLGLKITLNNPELFWSTPDNCKTQRSITINNLTVDNLSFARCPANPVNTNPNCPFYNTNRIGHSDCEDCTSWLQSYRDFIRQHPGNDTTVSVLFNGSRLYDQNGNLCNRSFHWYDNGIILQEISATNSEEYNSDLLPCFIHELSHDVNAPDHYHELLTDENGNRYCRGGRMCNECHPDTGRPEWCIMDNGWRSDLLTCEPNEVYCEGCKNDIMSHLEMHHLN